MASNNKAAPARNFAIKGQPMNIFTNNTEQFSGRPAIVTDILKIKTTSLKWIKNIYLKILT